MRLGPELYFMCNKKHIYIHVNFRHLINNILESQTMKYYSLDVYINYTYLHVCHLVNDMETKGFIN